MMKKLRIVNLEYAMVQGFYWAGFCGIVSYAAVYLQDRGYSNTQLGRILAFGYILGFLLPQLLAGWIDRSEKITVYRCQWVLLALQVGLVLTLGRLGGKSPVVSLLSCVLIGTEITLNPMNTEISADLELRLGHINYGAARGTGSIAFAPVSMLLGRLLESFGIAHLADQYPQNLSGGENHRVLIARALMNDPKIILADEATDSVDEENTKEILKIFRNLADQGKIVIFVSHDKAALKLCDKIIKID